jgi:16S rRNA (guanine(527)-N(7))-methyltransferase RsmG
VKHDFPLAFSRAKLDCSLLGVEVNEEFYRKTGLFLGLLRKTAGRMNLVGPDELERLWTRHVLESVSFIPFLCSSNVIDIGSGAGFPGIILALCGFSVTMVESRRKRCAFLETAARECGILCRVVNSRIEDAGPFPAGSQFTSRAVKGPAEMANLILSSAPEGFTLCTRVPAFVKNCSCTVLSEKLPVPPLDREGFILQYRHPGKQK